jgi:hypothetical protein
VVRKRPFDSAFCILDKDRYRHGGGSFLAAKIRRIDVSDPRPSFDSGSTSGSTGCRCVLCSLAVELVPSHQSSSTAMKRAVVAIAHRQRSRGELGAEGDHDVLTSSKL